MNTGYGPDVIRPQSWTIWNANIGMVTDNGPYVMTLVNPLVGLART